MYLNISDIRLENARNLQEELGLDREEFAQKTGVKYSLLGQYIGKNPTKNIGDKIARMIEKNCGKPENWLDVQHNASLPEEVQNILDNAPHPFTATDEDKGSRVMIDLYDVRACCGDGSTTFDFEPLKKQLGFDHSFFTHRSLKEEHCIMLYARNDSMEYYICDGDAVMVDKSDTDLKDGEVYAVWFADELMLKRVFKKTSDVIILSSDNKKYRDREVNVDNGTDFRVLGRVVYRSG